jgi:hypothetical protein
MSNTNSDPCTFKTFDQDPIPPLSGDEQTSGEHAFLVCRLQSVPQIDGVRRRPAANKKRNKVKPTKH